MYIYKFGFYKIFPPNFSISISKFKNKSFSLKSFSLEQKTTLYFKT